MVRRTFVLLAVTLALQACVAAPGQRQPAGSVLGRAGAGVQASTAVPAGHGVAILAPLTGPNAERGQALVRAAQLALAEPGSPTLDVRDTAGTAAGAAAAAQAAIGAGAGLIIGPLTAGETAAVAGPAKAADVPVLAFTSDPAQAQPGVWTLGITPAQQVNRLVGAMTAQGKTRFAAALPQNDFGNAMAAALGQAVAGANLPPPDIRSYQGGMSSINAVVRDISGYASRRGPLDAQIKAARNQHDAEGRKRAVELSRQGIPPPPFDALLLADTGDNLNTLASLLPYYDLDPPAVRVLGPALWASPAARGGAGLSGALYAAPDPASRADFDQKYTAAVGSAAPGLADFAYDAASIARVLAKGDGFSAASLCRPEGYAGVDGLLVLQPDGRVRRGLALFEIQRGGPVMTEPAPGSLASPGI
jgi:branched-chain amino acid transport system substrate-binding protein